MMFMTPTPPTISDMLPIAASSRAKVWVWRCICSISFWALRTLTDVRAALRRKYSFTSAVAAVWWTSGFMRATIWFTPRRGNRRCEVETGISTARSVSNGRMTPSRGGAQRAHDSAEAVRSA